MTNVKSPQFYQSFLKRFVLWLGLAFAGTAAAAPDIQHWQTELGARVYFVEAHEIPMISARVMFDAGSSRDGDRPGVAMLTSALLAEGADGLSADQISRGFDDLGANFGAGAGRDSSYVALQSLSNPELLGKAAVNLRRVISAPDFPHESLERERGRLLTSIRHKQQSPGDIAADAFYAAIYGDHPYAHPPEGTAESVTAITREDITGFYQRYYAAANAVVAIVGDLSRAQAEQLVDDLLANLPRGERAPALPEVPALTEAKTIRIEHPSTQMHILMGQPGIQRDDPDLFPLYVGNNVLGGGGLTTRLVEEIREKRGFSYSTYSYFMPMRRPGPFIAGLQTQNNQAEEARKLLAQQVEIFVKNGPTAKELDDVQKNITGGFPLRIDSNKDILEYIAMIGFYELPLDYLEKYTQKVMDVTVQGVQESFQRKLVPEKMVTVLVGQQND